jgi:uncharacterized protein Smg (DUF494 family)
MEHQDIVEQIRVMRARGISDKQIKKTLIDNGIKKMDVYAAFMLTDNLSELVNNPGSRPKKFSKSTTTKIIVVIVLLDVLFWILFIYFTDF